MARSELDRIAADCREVNRRMERAADAGDWDQEHFYSNEFDRLVERAKELSAVRATSGSA